MTPTPKMDDKKKSRRRSTSKEKKYPSPTKDRRQDNVTKYLEERKIASKQRAESREKDKAIKEKQKKGRNGSKILGSRGGG